MSFYVFVAFYDDTLYKGVHSFTILFNKKNIILWKRLSNF